MGGGTLHNYELKLQLHSAVTNPYTFNIKDNKNIYAKLIEELTLTIIFVSGNLGYVDMNSKTLLNYNGAMDTTTVVYKYSELGDLSGMIYVYVDGRGAFVSDQNINIKSTLGSIGTSQKVEAYIIDPTISAVLYV